MHAETKKKKQIHNYNTSLPFGYIVGSCKYPLTLNSVRIVYSNENKVIWPHHLPK